MAESGEPILFSLYVYAPNKGAPIFFTVAYGFSALLHIWQCYRYKSWSLVGLHPVCAVLLTAGYALREYGAYNYLYSVTTNLPLIIFVLSQVFIYVCPPLLELANYHVLGRVFSYVPYFAPIPPGRVLATFGGLMMIVEVLNALGVALASNPSSSGSQQSLGKHLTLAAIAMQVGIIAIFAVLATIFHWRCQKAGLAARAVKTSLLVLYTSMTLILIRCIYRLVEHTGNTSIDLDEMDVLRNLSPLLRYEAYFYVFEASLMLLNSWVWNIWHPGRFLPRDKCVYLTRDGTEVTGEKDEDSRPLLAKMAHVLTFGILFRDKEKGGHRQLQDLELTEYPPASRGSAQMK